MRINSAICVDASVLVDLLLELPRAQTVTYVVNNADGMVAPDVVTVEVLRAVRRLLLCGSISAEQANRAVARLASIPIEHLPTADMAAAAWSLRHNLTPMDACYVVAARSLGVPLLTSDLRLARAPGLGVQVIAV